MEKKSSWGNKTPRFAWLHHTYQNLLNRFYLILSKTKLQSGKWRIHWTKKWFDLPIWCSTRVWCVLPCALKLRLSKCLSSELSLTRNEPSGMFSRRASASSQFMGPQYHPYYNKTTTNIITLDTCTCTLHWVFPLLL